MQQRKKKILLHHQALERYFYVYLRDKTCCTLTHLHTYSLIYYYYCMSLILFSMTPLHLRSKRKNADDESDFEYFTSGKLFIMVNIHTRRQKMEIEGKSSQ